MSKNSIERSLLEAADFYNSFNEGAEVHKAIKKLDDEARQVTASRQAIDYINGKCTKEAAKQYREKNQAIIDKYREEIKKMPDEDVGDKFLNALYVITDILTLGIGHLTTGDTRAPYAFEGKNYRGIKAQTLHYCDIGEQRLEKAWNTYYKDMK